MKALVIKRLNRRLEHPSINSSKTSPLEINEVVDLEDYHYTGDPVNENKLWFRMRSGEYISSEGLKLNLSPLLQHLEVDKIWKTGINGQGVKIAIIDTGIRSEFFKGHIDVEKSLSFISSLEKPIFRDFEEKDKYNYHGTAIGGIISAPAIDKQMTSIAPGADLIILKVAKRKSNMDQVNLVADAIKWCIEQKDINLINLSSNYYRSEILDEAFDLLGKNKDTLLINSIGNYNKIEYPSTLDYVIGIGATYYNKEKWQDATFDKNFCTYGVNLTSLDFYGNPVTLNPGTSFACAVATGILALLINKYKSLGLPYDRNQLLKVLKEGSEQGAQYGAGFINLHQTIKLIK